MLTGLAGAALGIFGGAKRWLNGEALKALSFAIAAVCILVGCALLYGAGGSATEAKVNWRWLNKINAANAENANARAASEARMKQAAEHERDVALQELKAVADSKADLEAELATLKDNPVVFTRDERRRLYK